MLGACALVDACFFFLVSQEDYILGHTSQDRSEICEGVLLDETLFA